MRAYVVTTGMIFGLITLSHVLRMLSESRALATDPWFLLLTVLSAGLCVWAWRVFRQLPERVRSERR